MENPLVSVIIPIYNLEDYLLDCLKSVSTQTYQNYEVILVDDGSTDNSAKIAEEFIQNIDKERFRLIKKENGGVSSARNCGISEAKGTWITFIDGDDFVEPEYISYMVEGLQKHPADFCISGFKRCIDGKIVEGSAASSEIYHGSRSDVLQYMFVAFAVGKLFSLDIISTHNIRFDIETKVAEDRAFNFLYLCHVQDCLVLPNKNYIYRKRPGSAVYNATLPSKKRNLWAPVKRFWSSFDDEDEIKSTFTKSHHIAHSVLDPIFAELINAVLDKDKIHFREIVNDPFCKFCFENYKFKAASRREKFLCFLLKNEMWTLFKIIVKIYYSKFMWSITAFIKKNL